MTVRLCNIRCLTRLGHTCSRFRLSKHPKKLFATMLVGGLSTTKPATPEIQEIADQVKPQLEGKENKTYSVFVAIIYNTQVVAGINYFIKVSISNSNDECVHLKVFRSLPHENKGLILINYETGKTKNDPLGYF
nr:cystatin-A isoform X1 [Chrysemys picta bellii]